MEQPHDDHVHELVESERDEDFGVLYCWLCDVNADDLPDDAAVTFK